MSFLKKLAGILGTVLLLTSCILSGMYASVLNTSIYFSFLVGNATVAGLGVGLGVASMEASVILWIMDKKARDYLKRAQIPRRFVLVHRLRNLLFHASQEKMRMATMFILGTLPVAYWIVRPLYLTNIFQEHLPGYVALGRSNAPAEIPSGKNEDALESSPVDPDDNAPVDDTPEHTRLGKATKEVSQPFPAARTTPAPAPGALTHLPVRGKILPIDMERREIDPVLFDLSEAVRPQRPEEVGAIAALWWAKVPVGQYGSGSGDDNAAFQQHCTVMVWDAKTKSLLAERSFVGGMPPRFSLHNFPLSGSRPYDEIRDFLNGLPR